MRFITIGLIVMIIMLIIVIMRFIIIIMIMMLIIHSFFTSFYLFSILRPNYHDNVDNVDLVKLHNTSFTQTRIYSNLERTKQLTKQAFHIGCRPLWPRGLHYPQPLCSISSGCVSFHHRWWMSGTSCPLWGPVHQTGTTLRSAALTEPDPLEWFATQSLQCPSAEWRWNRVSLYPDTGTFVLWNQYF